MKKLLLSSLVLLIFSASLLLFQVSCKKSAEASPTPLTGIQQQNKLIYLLYSQSTKALTIHNANYDGSDDKDLNVHIPSNSVLVDNTLSISPDQKTLFFSITLNDEMDIYSCNIDGSNVRKVVSNGDSVIAY